jgi:hypothetical protein
MSQFYLILDTSGLPVESYPETVLTNKSLAQNMKVGEKMLIAQPKGDDYNALLPYTLMITKVDRQNGWLVLRREKTYDKKVPIDAVRAIINRPLSSSSTEITQAEFDSIVARMGRGMLEENELLDYIKRYIAAKGYYFDDETIYSYHICLKTRPLVILAGLSGTGKSKLSQLYAAAMGHTVQNKRYLRLAVRPSWNDDHYLLGYLNSITGKYVTEPAVDFIIKAEEDRDNLYFFCLDEMNLAHVEYYFSQVLSALEEENPADRQVLLFSEQAQADLEKAGRRVGVTSFVLIPPNLLFTGTINVDETTQPLSDKVIDRANTIEFFAVELDKVPERQPLPDPITISVAAWQSYIIHQPDTTYRSQIIEIGKILNKADLGLGYRILRDIELYLANSKNLLQPEVAFDLQVKQRILPRVRGTEKIRPELDELATFMKRNHLPRSERRLDEMIGRLNRDGYTNFWR